MPLTACDRSTEVQRSSHRVSFQIAPGTTARIVYVFMSPSPNWDVPSIWYVVDSSSGVTPSCSVLNSRLGDFNSATELKSASINCFGNRLSEYTSSPLVNHPTTDPITLYSAQPVPAWAQPYFLGGDSRNGINPATVETRCSSVDVHFAYETKSTSTTRPYSKLFEFAENTHEPNPLIGATGEAIAAVNYWPPGASWTDQSAEDVGNAFSRVSEWRLTLVPIGTEFHRHIHTEMTQHEDGTTVTNSPVMHPYSWMHGIMQAMSCRTGSSQLPPSSYAFSIRARSDTEGSVVFDSPARLLFDFTFHFEVRPEYNTTSLIGGLPLYNSPPIRWHPRALAFYHNFPRFRHLATGDNITRLVELSDLWLAKLSREDEGVQTMVLGCSVARFLLRGRSLCFARFLDGSVDSELYL